MPRRTAPEEPFHYRHAIEVRFGDTDALGHINNATYLTYFEAARAGYYEAMYGVPFGTGEGSDSHTFVLAEAQVNYRLPGFFGDRVVVECRVQWASRSSFGMEYRVISEGGPKGPARLLAEGTTVQVMFDLVRERVTRIPTELREKLERLEGRQLPAQRPD